MKRFKKWLGIVLCAAMVLTMGAIPSFADGPADGGATATKNDSITVTKAKAGETYDLYKMFDLAVDSETNPTAYSYTVTNEWKAFFATDAVKALITTNEAGYVTEVKDAEALAKAAAAYAKDANNNITAKATKVADGDSVVFNSLADGYYLVTSTLGTKAIIATTPSKSAVTINEKNPDNTIEKKVQEDKDNSWGKNNDAEVGQTVNFQSTANLKKGTRNVKVVDTMTSGLTYKKDLVIKNGETALTKGTEYTVEESDSGFTVTFADTYINGLTNDVTLTLTYSAVLNENAVVKGDNGVAIVDQNNKTKVTYGNGTKTTEDQTTTTTHKFSVYKHAKGATDNLAGAVFKLEKEDGTVIPIIKIDDNNYRVAKVNETGAVETFTTVANGDIVIWGVDSDTYKLEETAAPAGYNQLTDKVSVEVDKG